MSEKESENNINFDYELVSPFYSSGRINFLINNTGKENLDFIENNEVCFSGFVNDIFISQNSMFGNILRHIPNGYKFYEKESSGIFVLKRSLNLSADNVFKLISCNGLTDTYLMDAGDYNWWNDNWQMRKIIHAYNPSDVSLVEYQIEVDLNSSNFDFDVGNC